MDPWKDIFPIFHHYLSMILLHPSCHVQIQYIFISGMELVIYLIFERFWVDTVWLCVYIMLALVRDILIMKVITKVSVENRLNHVWRTCCFMSTSNFSRVSNTSYILNGNLLLSWFLCGLSSNFLYFISNKFMYRCRWFRFEIFIIYLPVMLFVFPVLSFNIHFSLLSWRYQIWNSRSYSPSPRWYEITRSLSSGLITPILVLVENTTARRS